ncbi:MAG: hypothetical protein ABW221_21175 [Vicinamibacteria bacterium]
MKRRPSIAFVMIAAALGAAILFALAWSPAVVTPEPGPRSEPSRAQGRPSVQAAGPDAGRIRNLFVYEEPVPTVVARPEVAPPIAVPPPLTLPPPNPVALVGFVRQGGGLRAALSIHGSVSVLAKGESADGYVVLAIDEDRGVTLGAPDGTEATLPPPPSR